MERKETLGEMIDEVVRRIGCTRPRALYMLMVMKVSFEEGFLEGMEFDLEFRRNYKKWTKKKS